MLCKKCKTAVSEGERRCPYCNARMRPGRKLKQAVSIAAACLIGLSCGALMYMEHVGIAPWSVEAELDAEAPVASDNPVPTPLPGDDVEPTPVPTATADLQKAMEDVWEMLEDTYRGAVLYMTANAANSGFVSQNGYLYQTADGAYVNAQMLIDAKMLDTRYAGDKILLLYLRPADTEAYAEVSFGRSLAPALFTAYETQDGVAFFGAGSGRGVLYRESMNTLLEQYAVSHGTIRRLSAADETYAALYGLVEAVEKVDAPVKSEMLDDIDDPDELSSTETGIDIRYLSADDRYACVVVSGKNMSDVLRTYIAVQTEEEGWTLLPLIYDGTRPLAEVVNRIAPDLSVSLLPDYEPDKVALLPAETFAFIVDFMLAQETISEADMPVDFVSGNEEMMYMVLRSGLRFYGRYSAAETVWKMFPVQSWMEAELLMRGASANPATGIIRQE